MRGILLASALCATACGAPEPEAIEGDLAFVLARGMEEGSGAFDHSRWDAILSKYVLDEGRRFDYAGLEKEEGELDFYLDALAEADLAALGASELEALFINAYNAYTVRTVLDEVSTGGDFAIESIRDVEDVFTREIHRVGGFTLSLDQIEHNVLRPTFRDPRIHFAVNCASISCPPLPPDAFVGERIDEQLEAAARKALGSRHYATVEDDALLLTKILDWYGGDFVNPEHEGAEKALALFVARYADEEVARWIRERGGRVEIRFREYDWRLNRP